MREMNAPDMPRRKPSRRFPYDERAVIMHGNDSAFEELLSNLCEEIIPEAITGAILATVHTVSEFLDLADVLGYNCRDCVTLVE
jgi:hypothetical protein